jgi:acyl-CoA reductase-like NAD-dependent aldehyde dehydrogenase
VSDRELSLINPYTEESFMQLRMLGDAEIEAAVERARAAFGHWRWVSVPMRVSLCRKFLAVFKDMGDTVASEITWQMGKPLQQSRNEVKGMLDRAEYMISIAEETLADEWLPEKAGFSRYIRHEPLGVVLDIAAWNYPLLIAVNVVVPAVLAGNAVLIKHSSRTPLCGEAFADAFKSANVPEHLVQNIVITHAQTDKLIKHPGIDYVSFTGSVKGGREVNTSAGGRFIPVGLELGGKDPAYVCADADFDYAVANTVDGAFYNAGQSCCAVERVYVERPIYDRFVEAYAALTRQYVLGDPMAESTSIGPLASKAAPAFLQAQVDAAVKAGGKLVISPREFDVPKNGWFAAPAVVADAPQDCALVQEESFGPVIAIVPVDDDEQAVTFMNDSPYGLTASIWTSDVDRAIRIGERIDTGTFYMNRCDYLDPALPWCGVKDTGRGATLSRYGLLNLTRLKSMHLRTAIPK